MVAEGVVRVFHDFSGLLMVFEVCSFVFFHGFKGWSWFLKVLHVFSKVVQDCMVFKVFKTLQKVSRGFHRFFTVFKGRSWSLKGGKAFKVFFPGC